MPYIFAAFFVAGSWAGYYVEHLISKAKVQAMETQIINANANAALILKNETDKAAASETQAIKSNLELDASHDAFIKTAADYDKQLDSIRLYADRGPCSASPTTASNPAGISEKTSSEAALDAEIERAIKEAAIVADIAADYAESAYKFATLNNCGLSRVEQ